MSNDDKLKRIEDKVDDIQEKISSIDKTLAAQHVSLKEHMRRTDILETKLSPIEKHVDYVEGIVKFIVFLSVIVGLVRTYIKITKG